MEVKFDVDRAIADFRAYNKKAQTNLEKAIVRASLQVEASAKQLFKGRDDESVPGEPPRVQTGRLRASITHRLERSPEGPVGLVGTNVEYAPHLEFGTSRMSPHPFLTPALEMNKADIEAAIAQAIREAE